MKYRCDHCNEYHDTREIRLNIGEEGDKPIDDIYGVVMGIVEKERLPLELLIYVLAELLEETKQTALKLGNESHRLDMIIHVGRNDVIKDIGIKEEGGSSSFN